MCEGRSMKIMEGGDCFRRGLSHGFKLPLSEKEQPPICFLSVENCFGGGYPAFQINSLHL